MCRSRRRWKRLADLAATRSRAAIELKRLDCCAWERPEAVRCEIHACALFALSSKVFHRRKARAADPETGQ